MRYLNTCWICLMVLFLASCSSSAPDQETTERVSPFPYERSRLFKRYLKQVAAARKINVPNLPPANGTIGNKEIWQTPFYLKTGNKPGPTVLIIGGTHGHEIAGWIAAQKLLDFKPDRGLLYIIPRVNYRGVEARHRFIPGESDLNRAYPGNPNGNIPARLAYDVFQFIKEKKIQILLDLHESFGYHLAEERSLGQSIIIYPGDEAALISMEVIETMNEKISNPLETFTLLQGPKKGSTAWAGGKLLGIQAYTLETSSTPPLEVRVAYQIQMVQSILQANDIRLIHDDS